MTKEELLDLFKNYIITTPDGRLVGDKENRFNTWMFSYTGKSGQIYTAPRKKRWSSGKSDTREILNDRINALGKKNKPTKEIEAFNCGYGYEFGFDHEVIVLIEDDLEWKELLAKNGLTSKTIPLFEAKYKKGNLRKYYFQMTLDKRLFRLDLYDPIRHLDLEHDGSWCHIPEIDAARDEYLSSHFPGLHIERITDYDPTKPEKKEELKKIFDTYNIPLWKEPLVFNYDSWVIEQQLLEQQEELDFISEYLKRGHTLGTIPSGLATKLNRYAALEKA